MQTQHFLLLLVHIKSAQLVNHGVTFIVKLSLQTQCICCRDYLSSSRHEELCGSCGKTNTSKCHLNPVSSKAQNRAHTLLHVCGHTYRCLCGFVSGEDVCWFVWAGFLWLRAAALLLRLWVRVSESFHEGTIQHLSEKQLTHSDLLIFLMTIAQRYTQQIKLTQKHRQRLKFLFIWCISYVDFRWQSLQYKLKNERFTFIYLTTHYLFKPSSLTSSLAHPLLSPSPSLSSPALCTGRSSPRSPPEPASGSAPSAPGGSPKPPSPSWNPLCGSPKPDRELGNHQLFIPIAD